MENLRTHLSEGSLQIIRDQIDSGKFVSAWDVVDFALSSCAFLINIDTLSPIFSAQAALLSRDIELRSWNDVVRTHGGSPDTTAGILVLYVAKDCLKTPMTIFKGAARRTVPTATRKLLLACGVSGPMVGRICGAAGRLSANPVIRAALMANDAQKVIFACDSVLKDGQDGNLNLGRLDKIGKL